MFYRDSRSSARTGLLILQGVLELAEDEVPEEVLAVKGVPDSQEVRIALWK